MTGRPETLEAALAWLHAKRAGFDFAKFAVICNCRDLRSGSTATGAAMIHNGDIPAAIVEAVQQVWDQVHGKGEA